ncbi:MAG: 3-dehydroquinate synthase [Nitrospira sp.]|nr:3-dehydroquinate synthase [Nitrospira sp.]
MKLKGSGAITVMPSSTEKTIQVDLGERSYKITVKPGLLSTVGTRLARLTHGRKVGIVTDTHVASRYLAGLRRSLSREGLEPVSLVLPPGERTKSLKMVGTVLDVLARRKFDRHSMLVALGGGVVGDLTGFAAAIYLRGIPFVQVPTTLVAQVDSSVGGKTGVDHRLGKNLIGAFHQPRAVFIDPDTLRTLPRREWIAGLAEVIKYGVIADEAMFSRLERTMPALLKVDPSAVMPVIVRSCEIKAQIVVEDEKETDRRRTLNYGHTIGHALESLGGYRGLIHGEAVGIGLVQEASVASFMGLCSEDVVGRITSLVRLAGLADRMGSVSLPRLWEAMLHDKKAVAGQVVGVWPVRIGETVIKPVSKEVFVDWYKKRVKNAKSPVARNQQVYW